VTRAKVWFIGAGPGAPGLLTVRGARAIGEADIVIWGANLVMEEAVSENAAPDAELIPWPPATMEDILAAYDRALEHDQVIARLVGGDPAIYVDMSEEIERARDLGIPFEIVPGVGALSAAAAALGGEVVTAQTDRSLLISSPKAAIEELADPGETVAVYMTGKQRAGLQGRLLAAGYQPGTPCAIVNRVTWPDQTVVRCRLDELESLLERERSERQTLLLVGPGVPGMRLPSADGS
jgi:precorrin-4/cobalt-precorrin-4 C11-methyltransferase